MPDLPLPPRAVLRLDDWLGLWAIDAGHAARLLAAVREVDWPSHLERASAAAAAAAPAGKLDTAEVDGKRIAIVPLVGTMMKSRSSFGGASTVDVRRQVRAAAADTSISGILLQVDSPGGTVAGTEALAADVAAARRRKPVVAQVEDLGASAAYWVASQASKIYASGETALVGSIGTLLVVSRSADGLAVFRSGPHKGAGLDGELTDDQAAHLQGLVDGWQAQFTGAVSRGRRLRGARLDAVTTGAAWLAGTAKDLGLIDGVQSVEQTLDQLAATR